MPKSYQNKVKYYKLGVIAEYIAMIFLFLKGYRIVRHRYRNKLGEIDIIALKKDLILAIEVKARRKILKIDGLLGVKQQNRIKRSILLFAKNHKIAKNKSIRFDLIVVNNLLKIKHIKGFWN